MSARRVVAMRARAARRGKLFPLEGQGGAKRRMKAFGAEGHTTCGLPRILAAALMLAVALVLAVPLLWTQVADPTASRHLAAGCEQAWAAGASNALEDITEITELSDRYASINDLTTSRNSDERLIVDTSIGVLTTVNRALNGMPVRFTGEAIGDVLAAEDGKKWVNVLGTSGTSIGVFMDEENAAQIANLGSYHTTGATLEVEGTYSIACGKHQGELDVHATSVTVVDQGGRITHQPDRAQVLAALGLCALGFGLLGAFAFLRSRSNREAGGSR